MGTYNNLFKSHHPTILDKPKTDELLMFPMSTDKITNQIKNLLKKYNFNNEIIPKISSSLSKRRFFKDNYNEEIKLTLKERDCTDDCKQLKVILNGVRNDDGMIEYTIGAMVNTPSNCSIYRGITIKSEKDITYYLNSLLRKLKDNKL